MKQTHKTSMSFNEDELGILDAIASQHGFTRTETLRHLIVYQGLVGGEFPLTTRILGLPEAQREKVVAEIRRKAEAGEFVKPQSFKIWIKEFMGSDDPAAVAKGVESLLQKLMEG